MIISYKNENCVSCLDKIQNKMQEDDRIESFEIDRIHQEIHLTGLEESALYEVLKSVSHQYAPQMKLQVQHEDHEHEHSSAIQFKLKIGLFIVAIGFLIAGFVLKQPVWTIIAYFLFAGEILWKTAIQFKNRNFFDENSLMSIASLGALCLGEYYEAIAVMILYQLGEYLQDKAVDRSKESIKALLEVQVEIAHVKRSGKIETVSPKTVKKGEIIVVKVGEKVPLDGQLIQGSTSLDMKAITGESKYVDLNPGDFVLSGSVNLTGAIEVQVERAYNESTIQKMAKTLKEALKNRSTTEKFITKFSHVYTPIVFFLALCVAFLMPLFFIGTQSYQALLPIWIERSLIFLVIACPCALVISVPLAYFAGIGLASKNGILIKGSHYLDEINEIKMVAMDKTGTLTKGNFIVSEIYHSDKITDNQFKELLAVSEAFSTHPIARSILKFCHCSPDLTSVTQQEEAGFGVKTNWNNSILLLGNAKLLKKYDVQFMPVQTAKTILYLAKDNQFLGWVTLEDEIKVEAAELIHFLHSKQMQTVLLTGDNDEIGQSVSSELGITHCYAKLLPEEKLNLVKSFKEKEKIAYIGDGINDSLALAMANVGIAMGKGSDLAILSADVVIGNDHLSKVISLFKIAQKTRSIALLNIVFALTVKICILGLGFFGFTNMWIAIIADVGVSLLAILNSIRILKSKI